MGALFEQLAGETNLRVARQQADSPIRLPAYPAGLGEPQRVFVQDADGAMVVLIWLDPARPDHARLSLHLIEEGSWALYKMQPQIVQETLVRGHRAIWAVGPYPLILRTRDVAVVRLIDGHMLIWIVDGITYRVETDLPLEEAVRVADSMH